jgi:hypothetical protein
MIIDLQVKNVFLQVPAANQNKNEWVLSGRSNKEYKKLHRIKKPAGFYMLLLPRG